MLAKWQTMSECRDNQEVGLEAATLERVRNSSLVKCSGAENSTGLKLVAEATDFSASWSGRGASFSGVKRRCEPSWTVDECECRHE